MYPSITVTKGRLARSWKLALWTAVGLLGAWAVPLPAWAAEYKLQVVSIPEEALAAFLTSSGEYVDGASGPGLGRLERSLDQGEVSKGVFLYDRALQPASETVARGYGGVPVRAEVRRGGVERQLWDEVRWEGNPGEVTVWVVPVVSTRNPQRLFRLALKGSGPLRLYSAHTPPPRNGTKVDVARFPLNYLWFVEERGTAPKHVSRFLDLSRGIGAVVGVNRNLSFSDQVYLVVNQGEQPSTYKVVLVWSQEEVDRHSLPGTPDRR